MFYHDDSLGMLRIQYFFVAGPIFTKMYEILHEIKRNWVLRIGGGIFQMFHNRFIFTHKAGIVLVCGDTLCSLRQSHLGYGC